MAKKGSRRKNKVNMKKRQDSIKQEHQEIKDTTATVKDSTDELKESGSQDSLLKEAELQQKIDDLNDKYLRLYSEFDNFRKRTIREKLEYSKMASEEVISELLPVLDDFERAIKSSQDIENCEPVKEGVNLILNKLKGILEKKGLKPITAIGEVFNTDYHEAITYIPATSEEMKGKIMDEIEKGYMLNDKVIRYTKVVIGQ
ncbi:MAG: nucleotide exchange factor GrpE [Bacteroidales bacterium]|nr:nucleotide exchange factor GrpE [Bacteroidales bacterium]